MMTATFPPLLDFGTDESFDVTIRHGRSQHAHNDPLTAQGAHDLAPTASPRQASRAWPVAQGFIYIVDSYPGLAQLAKTLLELEGYSACAFEDRAKAWQAFAFAVPRPALLITDNLDGDAPAMELIRRCRSLEPKLKTLLVDHRLPLSPRSPDEIQVDGLLPLPYCCPLLVQEVQRICAGKKGSKFSPPHQVQP